MRMRDGRHWGWGWLCHVPQSVSQLVHGRQMSDFASCCCYMHRVLPRQQLTHTLLVVGGLLVVIVFVWEDVIDVFATTEANSVTLLCICEWMNCAVCLWQLVNIVLGPRVLERWVDSMLIKISGCMAVASLNSVVLLKLHCTVTVHLHCASYA